MASKNQSFEMSMARLEEIVRTLEGGNSTLDEALKLYEEGIALVRTCSAKLDDAEKKVKLLNIDAEGNVKETDIV